VSRDFGPAAAPEKLRLLEEIAERAVGSRARLVRLHDTLYFLRAYPDDPAVLREVNAHIGRFRARIERYTKGDPRDPTLVNTGLPGTSNAYAYSYAVLQRLVALSPGCLELDWEEIRVEAPVTDVLILAAAAAEVRGLEDEYLSLREWLSSCRSSPEQTGLEIILKMLRDSRLDPRVQMHVFETAEMPVIYTLRDPGSGRCEIAHPSSRIFYQRSPVPRTNFPLRPRIQRPPAGVTHLSPSAGQAAIDLSLRALCSRNLEIHPLIYANPWDVTVVSGGRGLEVWLVGMLPGLRCVPETLLFFLVLKNGIPVAYGPASVFLGCCEMGINLFGEFRGGEIRFVYALVMRALRHLASVRYFFLTSYGMGEGNEEALRSGAFWFYRKLGFRATNPEVEALAREQEDIMRRRPGYRCSIETLRKLSNTEAHFDLSRGTCRPVDFGGLGQAVSRYVTDRFGGDRDRARNVCARELAKKLRAPLARTGKSGERWAALEMAPLLCALPGLDGWSARDRRALAAVVRAKGGRREIDYARKAAAHPRLREAIESLS
jgi:hypothetical protein